MQRHSPAPPAVRAELERVLASETFQNAERLRRFLRFVVEESLGYPGATLKEHWVAINVFDRPESFDPRSDSVVRIAARQLRFKLRDYYETEGREDTIRMNLPKGSYVPVFEFHERPAAPRRKLLAAAGGAVIVIVTASGYFLPKLRGPAKAPLTALAVLPFAGLGDGVEVQYLASGFVDEFVVAVIAAGVNAQDLSAERRNGRERNEKTTKE